MKLLQKAMAIAVMATTASLAFSQPGGGPGDGPGGQGGPGGRRMGGPQSGMMLVRMSTVQTELQLTAEQIKAIEAMRPRQGGPQQGGPPQGGPPKGGGQGGENRQDPLAEILTAAQNARLKQLVLQFDAPQTILDRRVAEQLELTEEQRQAIHEAIRANMPPPGERGSQPPVWGEMQAKKAAATKAALKVLTSDQLQTWTTLTGKTFTNWVEPPRR